jgi:preprotein translocase subunit SecA
MYGGERVEKMMEFLKIEEDMPIESGMLSKAIENAQKKVEGRNFDVRKHLLQYDDVMNKQRTVIYDERKRILLGGDLKEQTLGFIRTAIHRVVEMCTVHSGRSAEIDFDALVLNARQNFPIGELTPEDFEGRGYEEVLEMLEKKVLNLYEQKEEEIGRAVLLRMAPEMPAEDVAARAREFGAQQLREIERVITLKAIDQNWIDHLNMLDHLRSGVSLRGYGQQDPVVVFAQEAFAEFDKFKEEIEADVVRKVFLVRIEAPPTERKSAYNIQQAMHPTSSGTSTLPPSAPRTTEAGVRIAERRTAPKLGRNTKCYCGSGKKYKQCHLPEDGGNPPDNWPELYQKAYGEEAPGEAA